MPSVKANSIHVCWWLVFAFVAFVSPAFRLPLSLPTRDTLRRLVSTTPVVPPSTACVKRPPHPPSQLLLAFRRPPTTALKPSSPCSLALALHHQTLLAHCTNPPTRLHSTRTQPQPRFASLTFPPLSPRKSCSCLTGRFDISPSVSHHRRNSSQFRKDNSARWRHLDPDMQPVHPTPYKIFSVIPTIDSVRPRSRVSLPAGFRS